MLKHFYRLMVVALGLFVVSSCGEATPKYGNIYVDYDDATVDEDVGTDIDGTLYGCWPCRYYAAGNVVDKIGDGIPGIEVLLVEESAVLKSNVSGQFEFNLEVADSNCSGGPITRTLRFTDVDGIANGGEFAEKEIDVVLTHEGSSYPCYMSNDNIRVTMEEATTDDDILLPDDDTLLKD